MYVFANVSFLFTLFRYFMLPFKNGPEEFMKPVKSRKTSYSKSNFRGFATRATRNSRCLPFLPKRHSFVYTGSQTVSRRTSSREQKKPQKTPKARAATTNLIKNKYFIHSSKKTLLPFSSRTNHSHFPLLLLNIPTFPIFFFFFFSTNPIQVISYFHDSVTNRTH